MAKIRFGVIGCGYIAKKTFIPALKKSCYAELVAVASRDKNIAKSFSIEFGCNYEKNYETLLSRDDLDAVYIATIPSTHEEFILMSAKYGKHILCEKPLTTSYNSAKKIVSYCKNSNVGILEGFMYQYHTQHKYVTDFIKRGNIGKPILFEAKFGFPLLEEDNYRYQKIKGGGSLLDAGVYTIHSARNFFQKEPREVFSLLNYEKNKADINGSVLMDFGNNQMAQLSFGFDNYYQNNYQIWCTRGVIRVNRAFSIPPNQVPQVSIEMQNEHIAKELEPCDQFERQIAFFVKGLKKIKTKEMWYKDIAAQSEILHKIIKNKENV